MDDCPSTPPLSQHFSTSLLSPPPPPPPTSLRTGKKNLEKALKVATPRASKDVQFKTQWRPFFLMRPEVWTKGVASGEFPQDAQTKGIVKLNYYISKFGANRLPPMLERLEGAMTASGIDGFSMGGNTGPTLDGHRLATYAEKEGLEKQNAFMEEIFKAGNLRRPSSHHPPNPPPHRGVFTKPPLLVCSPSLHHHCLTVCIEHAPRVNVNDTTHSEAFYVVRIVE